MREYCARCIMSKKTPGVTSFVEEIMFNVKAKTPEHAKKLMEKQANGYLKGQGARINTYRILDIAEVGENGTILSRAVRTIVAAVSGPALALPPPAAAAAPPQKLPKPDMFRGLGRPTCKFTDMYKLATISKYVKPESVSSYNASNNWPDDTYGRYQSVTNNELDDLDDWDSLYPRYSGQMCD